jgi:hypothetical protein
MAIDDNVGAPTPPIDEADKTSTSRPTSTASIPVTSLPAGTDIGDTLQIKITDMDGTNARVQIIRSTAPQQASTTSTQSKPGFNANMPVNQMRDWLTQEATIHAADQTSV